MTDHEFGDCSLTVCDLCFMYVKGHSADVYGVTNNYGEVLSGGFPGCLLPTQTRKPRVPRGDPQRRGRRRAARRPRKPTKPQMPKVVVRTGG